MPEVNQHINRFRKNLKQFLELNVSGKLNGSAVKVQKKLEDAADSIDLDFDEELRSIFRDNPSIRVKQLEGTDSADDLPLSRADSAWILDDINVDFPVKPWHTDPEKAVAEFNLKGIEFGNWLNAENRVEYLAETMQALHYISKVLGVSHKQIGIGSKLGIAFGSRGTGGSAVAHYEPVSNVMINLTKEKGQRALAHEYTHALDNLAEWETGQKYISGGRSMNKGKDFLDGSDPLTKTANNFFNALFWSDGEKSNYYNRMVDATDYEQRRTEILARCGDIYITQECKERDFPTGYVGTTTYGRINPTKKEFTEVQPILKTFFNQVFDLFDGKDLEKSESKKEKKPEKKEVQSEGGKETTVDFKPDGSQSKKGRYQLIELKDLTASHNKDCSVNSKHRISKGQPRDRSLDNLCAQPKFIAKNLNPSSITQGNLAFQGAPVVTKDGMVIQGNGRSISLKIAYDEIPKNAKKYKEYLAKHAKEFGFTKSDVTGMKQPVLVRMLDVDDKEAIRLGNIVDTSQAKMSRIDTAKATIRNLNSTKLQAIGRIIAGSNGETMGAIIDDIGIRIFDQVKDLDRTGLIEDGELTSDGKEFLRSVLTGIIFDSEENKSALRDFLDNPHTIQAGIERSFGSIIPLIGQKGDIREQLQEAVQITAEVKRNDAFDSVADVMSATDMFSGQKEYSQQGQDLATFFLDAGTQKAIRDAFRVYVSHIEGKDDLFNPIKATSQPKAFQEAFGGSLSEPPKQKEETKNESGGNDELTVEDFKKDIPKRLAYDAYSNRSFSPDKRAERAISDYANKMHSIYEEFMQAEDKGEAEKEFDRFREKAKKLQKDILQTGVGIASSFVVGPSNFPAKRMRSRLDSEQKKVEKFIDYTSRVKNKVLKKLGVIEGSNAIVSGTDGAVDKLQKKIEKLEKEREEYKKINKLLRKEDDEGLKEMGLTEAQIDKFKEPDFAGRTGIPPYMLKNIGAKIRRYKKRLEAEKKKEKRAEAGNIEIEVEDATIIENFDDNRLQVLFEEKPPKDVRDKLKSNGFKWAPSKSVWQRQLTNNARQAVKKVFPELYNKKRENPPEHVVKLYTPADFDQGDIIRDYYEDEKFWIEKIKGKTYHVKSLKTGKKETFNAGDKRFIPNRDVTPTLDMFDQPRKNFEISLQSKKESKATKRFNREGTDFEKAVVRAMVNDENYKKFVENLPKEKREGFYQNLSWRLSQFQGPNDDPLWFRYINKPLSEFAEAIQKEAKKMYKADSEGKRRNAEGERSEREKTVKQYAEKYDQIVQKIIDKGDQLTYEEAKKYNQQNRKILNELAQEIDVKPIDVYDIVKPHLKIKSKRKNSQRNRTDIRLIKPKYQFPTEEEAWESVQDAAGLFPFQVVEDHTEKSWKWKRLDTVRNNPKAKFVMLGVCRELVLDQKDGQATLDGPHAMFTNKGKDKLFVVPFSHLKEFPGDVKDKTADQIYEMWHNFPTDDRNFELWWPDVEPYPIGYAHSILYDSDKIMREGDRKGKMNLYEHEFGEFKRPAFVKGSILIISNLKINERGILN